MFDERRRSAKRVEMKISPSRIAAFDVLLTVEAGGGHSSTLLAEVERDLSPQDASLTHEIVLGVLRTKLTLDHYIDKFSNGKALDIEVRIASRIGLYQFWYLTKVPLHAIVNESVMLTARAKKSSAKGFVNALLRRAQALMPPITAESPLDALSIETSHPAWLLERWSAQFGSERAASIAMANNVRPRLSFRKTGKFRPEDDPKLSQYSRSNIAPDGFVASGMDETLAELAASGNVYFQESASQLVGSSLQANADGKILDLCAAPGGKTAQISLSNPAASLIACDRTDTRTLFLRKNLTAQGVDPTGILQLDATEYLPFSEQIFDLVFIDAPCSGTGTIRNNPEIRYRVSDDEIVRASRKQRLIVENASKCVKDGGELIYATCSLELEENESVITSFLEGHPDFSIAEPRLPQRFHTAEGFARTEPDRDDCDGFFIARLERRSRS